MSYRCKKHKREMVPFNESEDGKTVEGWRCPVCGFTLYKGDNPMVYRRMGLLE